MRVWLLQVRNMIIKLLIPIAVFVITLVVIHCIGLWYSPDLHLYPAITRCRCCNCRIWAWQNYERREFNVKAENPDHIAVSVGMSGLVHCSCKEIPETTVKITSNSISIPTLGAKEAIGVSIPIRESVKK